MTGHFRIAAAAAVVSLLPLAANAVTMSGNSVKDTDFAGPSPYLLKATQQTEIVIGLSETGDLLAYQFDRNGFPTAKAGATVAPPDANFVQGLKIAFNDTPDFDTPLVWRQITDANGDLVNPITQVLPAFSYTGLPDFFYFVAQYDGLDPNDPDRSEENFTLAIQGVQAIPLPASVLMLIGALGGLGYIGFAGRRRAGRAS